jgi:ubiquinone/menaquinone biosynthesis C-methylase UbiE
VNQSTSEPSDYIHGSSPEEQHRLSLLNSILNESCLRELGLRKGQKVLDVGSGLGQFTRLMANAVGCEGRVVGIERSLAQRAQAQRLADESGEAGLVDFRAGDALDLVLSDADSGTFDVVHARFLLEHLPRPAAAIEQMVRAARPGGRVFVADDDHDNFRPYPEPAGFLPLWKGYVRSFEMLGNDPYVGRRLVSLLRENGLSSIRNSSVFFGGCAGNERFEAVADNLIGAIGGARAAILSGGFVDETAFNRGMDGLQQWKTDPSAVLWYTVCCAEGYVPE